MSQTLSSNGLAHLKRHEGCKLEAYPDPASRLFKMCVERRIDPYTKYMTIPNWQSVDAAPWTIGYGHTGPDVNPGLKISQDYAEELLRRRLANEFEPAINDNVKVPLSQNEFDALVSFVYNVGVGAFKKSTMLKKLNLRDYIGASEEFDKWNKPAIIVDRRKAEKDLFNKV